MQMNLTTAFMATHPHGHVLPDAATPDSFEVLLAGQMVVRQQMQRYRQRLRPRGVASVATRVLVRKICATIAVQLHLEEEILYPHLRESLGESQLIDAAQASHAHLHWLIRGLARMSSSEPMYDARVRLLSDLFDKHQTHLTLDLYPLAHACAPHLAAWGQELAARRFGLWAEVMDHPQGGFGFGNQAVEPVGLALR